MSDCCARDKRALIQLSIKCLGPNHLPQFNVSPSCADNRVDKPPYQHVRDEPAFTAGRYVDARWPSKLVLKDIQNFQTRS